MILTIFLSGMIVSILIDWLCYVNVRKGVKIDSYPNHYLRYTKYKLFRSWVLWALLWPLVLTVSVVTNVLNWVKK